MSLFPELSNEAADSAFTFANYGSQQDSQELFDDHHSQMSCDGSTNPSDQDQHLHLSKNFIIAKPPHRKAKEHQPVMTDAACKQGWREIEKLLARVETGKKGWNPAHAKHYKAYGRNVTPQLLEGLLSSDESTKKQAFFQVLRKTKYTRAETIARHPLDPLIAAVMIHGGEEQPVYLDDNRRYFGKTGASGRGSTVDAENVADAEVEGADDDKDMRESTPPMQQEAHVVNRRPKGSWAQAAGLQRIYEVTERYMELHGPDPKIKKKSLRDRLHRRVCKWCTYQVEADIFSNDRARQAEALRRLNVDGRGTSNEDMPPWKCDERLKLVADLAALTGQHAKKVSAVISNLVRHNPAIVKLLRDPDTRVETAAHVFSHSR